jgi:hypothetical protein
MKGAKVAKEECWRAGPEELGPFLSSGGVERERPCRSCVVGERPSAPLDRNDRAVRGDPCVLHAHTLAPGREISGGREEA